MANTKFKKPKTTRTVSNLTQLLFNARTVPIA